MEITIENLVKQYPNYYDLGKQVRKHKNQLKEINILETLLNREIINQKPNDYDLGRTINKLYRAANNLYN